MTTSQRVALAGFDPITVVVVHMTNYVTLKSGAKDRGSWQKSLS